MAHPSQQLKREFLVDGGRQAPDFGGQAITDIEVANRPQPTVTRTVSPPPTRFKTEAQKQALKPQPRVVAQPASKAAVPVSGAVDFKEALKSPGQKAMVTRREVAVATQRPDVVTTTISMPTIEADATMADQHSKEPEKKSKTGQKVAIVAALVGLGIWTYSSMQANTENTKPNPNKPQKKRSATTKGKVVTGAI